MDAIISTDGDSDRPLVATAAGEWVRGDLLGLLCARVIGADCVVTPVSSNTAVELCGAFRVVRRTRIGSPYVIAAMKEETAKAETASVCGYEANGGFLLGSALTRDERTLTALPTRDAVLPILAVLTAAKSSTLADVVAALPPRVTFSDRIAGFATKDSQAIVAYLQDGAPEVRLARVATYFGEIAGAPTAIDTTDGIRITFATGSIIHLRPSGNAPEIRCYTEADDEAQAQALNRRALAIVREQLLPGARASV
jgi:phosphomannomutase